MSNQKMDFREWQASNPLDSDEDAIDAINEFSKKLRILTFILDKKGSNIVSMHNGCVIFVDRNFQSVVSIGDTWICSTQPGLNCEYATPLLKITLNDVLNFNEQLRENVLNLLWKKHGADLKVIFENKYKPELQSKIAEELKEDYEEKVRRISAEKDEIESELRQTRFQLDNQRSYSPVLEDEFIMLNSDDVVKTPIASTSSNDSETIDVSTSGNSQYVELTSSQQSNIARVVPQIKRTKPLTQKYEVERIGPDSLYSPSFTDNRYFVHISPDYKVLVIRPNEEGNVYCLNKVIRLKNLGFVSGFSDKKFLVSEYSDLYGGMIVRLRLSSYMMTSTLDLSVIFS